MKLFAAALVASAHADCIISPLAYVKDKATKTGTSWGPIWKKFTSCSAEPYTAEIDGAEYVMLPAGARCDKVFCNLKTGGNVAKYKYFECDAEIENQLNVQHWWKGDFVFKASTTEFLCPTVRDAGCPWHAENNNFLMPLTKEQTHAAALAAPTDGAWPETCGRAGHMGFDYKEMWKTSSDVDPNGQRYYFQKKKFDVYCDRFVPDKKIEDKFNHKGNQKTGTRFTCLCGSKASVGQIKTTFQTAVDEYAANGIVTSMKWTDINCKWSGTNKLFGKQDNPYIDAKKGTCDDGFFEDQGDGNYHADSTECCDMAWACGTDAICTPDEVMANYPFHGDGYTCSCADGYKMVDFECVQADPCLENNGGCHTDATCSSMYDENGIGTANCACNDGYNGDGLTCTPESCEVNNGNCSKMATCSQNEDGTFNCVCQEELFWQGDGTVCNYNPCGMNACDANSACSSSEVGSFDCACNQHFISNGESGSGVVCTHMCDAGIEVHGCSVHASCTPIATGIVGPGYQCTCINGFEGDGINCACPAGKGVVGDGCYASHPDVTCLPQSAWSWETNSCVCVANSNSDSEGNCLCNDGYQASGNDCADIDECAAPDACDANQDCFNNDGGFSCVCKTGYTKLDALSDTCVDIDECAAGFPANVACANLLGTHELSCVDGFELAAGADIAVDGCVNIDECLIGTHTCKCADGLDDCSITCTDLVGSFQCACHGGNNDNGFQLDEFGVCVDVDECLTNPCEENEDCTNNNGSFSCGCVAAWLDDNSVTCNECKFGLHTCDFHAECVDLASGYDCVCNNGYSDIFEELGGVKGHQGMCKQDGEWAPLVVKNFTEGLSMETRTGIFHETTVASEWPILPSTFSSPSCLVGGKKNWDRDHDGYVTLFNSMILDNVDSYKGPNVDDEDFLDQVSFPEPANAWSWGTWSEWGEWTTTCKRAAVGCETTIDGKANKGYQTRERECLVDGLPACYERCMPVDDEGRTPMDSDKKKYPFTNRVDRVTETDKNLWWVDPVTSKKVKSYTFEEPFNPYYDGDVNWLREQHKQMYAECRQAGAFLMGLTLPQAIFPVDFIEANAEEHDEAMKYLCTSQMRECDAQVAEWVHDGPDGEVVSGWSEWSQCYANVLPDSATQTERDNHKCSTSGNVNGNFASPYNLGTHHYQQRTRRCSTGCFADCMANVESPTTSFEHFKESWAEPGSTSKWMAWTKIGDPLYPQRGGVNWRACHHEQLSYGCPSDVFGGWKSHVSLGNKCYTPIPTDLKKQDSLKNMNGFLKEGTICSEVYSSMNPIDNAPYWDVHAKPNGKDRAVKLECKCPGGCNSCHWEIISDQNILGVPDVMPAVSHLNGYMVDYSFAAGVKHEWDYRHDEIMAKSFRFWDEGEFPNLWKADSEGLRLCVSAKNNQKKQFGYLWSSSYHWSLYNAAKDIDWYNWNQYMCRYGLRFGETSYQYFTETDFEIFQVEDKNTLSWVDANKFMVENWDPSQIVTAADNDSGDKDDEVTYDGDLSNWRIQGACRIILRCSKTMVKQYNNGKIEIPCTEEGMVYDVKEGSLRMYTQGSYYDGVNNATAPEFCCKEAQYLHWAEPLLHGYGDLENTRSVGGGYNPFDDSRTLSPMQQIWAQSERKVHQDKTLAKSIVDDAKRECDSANIQILSVNVKKSVTFWSEWSSCSVSCGTETEPGVWTGGVRTRKRSDIIQNYVEGFGLKKQKYNNEQIETEACNEGPCQMTHWGEWGEYSGCSKQKDKNNEKWQKRKRECWFQGASFSSWKSANKGSKSKTLDDVHCPKDDDTEWRCCCNEQNCLDDNGNSLCP